MGILQITIGVGDPAGNTFQDLDVVVDTGSTNSVAPKELLESLGVRITDKKPTLLANGSVVTSETGYTLIRLEGQVFPTPFTFADPKEPSVLGVIALEQAALAVDPVGQGLVPTNLLRL